MTNTELYNFLKNNLSEVSDDATERLFFARRLFSLVTGLSQQHLVMEPDGMVPDSKVSDIDEIMRRVRSNEPLEYIFNSAQFMDLEFFTNGSVLIPRPETEELALMILNDLRRRKPGSRLLDIGTGSGCIPVYLCHEHPQAQYTACDISKSALDTAAQNAMRHGCQIRFAECDIINYEKFDFINNEKFDIIVSNPPYVLDSEKALMKSNVLDFEPHNALFVPDSDPLLFYRRICEYASGHLERGGALYFEINERYGKETATLMENCGFCNVEIIKDLFSKDRFTFGCLA